MKKNAWVEEWQKERKRSIAKRWIKNLRHQSDWMLTMKSKLQDYIKKFKHTFVFYIHRWV